MKHPLIELFHLLNLLQIPNNHRMTDTEFLGKFLCNFKRINFDNALNWLLSTSDGQPVHYSSSRLSSAKLLEPPLHYVFINRFWAKCIADVVVSTAL